ncbi:FAD-dependent oxidoreductase [Kribbella sp. NPDC051620]|uniref:FAD-dependent oxidoreductase n=1 Tax=Kribbella sp. NPDC051620 TaxID=3364120 RepID=UPI00378DA2B4
MYDVVIVGAGPVGLFLACEVGLAGCSVLVLEREAEEVSPWRAMPLGMRGLSAASVEAFYRRGMLQELLAASGRSKDLEVDEPLAPQRVGHFAGMMLDESKVNLEALPYRLPTPAPGGAMTSLEAVEGVLAERAAKLGVEIRYGVTVDELTQYEDKVVVGQEYEARWVVGCDGGRSAVRGLAGFEFAGTEPQFTGYVMDATVADPDKLKPWFNPTPTGMYVRMPIEGHLGMMDFDGGAFDRSQRLTREHLQEVLRRVSGTDVTLSEVRRASSFTDRAMQATTYRQGRVLLAGDAAHIHSPLGGQGLNLGIGDAMNLGWKLAATVKNQARDAGRREQPGDPGLLDSYAAERQPIAARVLDWSRAQVATMAPGSEALQGLIRDLLETRDGTTYAFERLSGASIRYDLGSEHPLVGRVAPEFRLEDGRRLADLMRDGEGVLLDFSRRLRNKATAWEGRIRYSAQPARNDLGLAAALVRPDGVVAWAATTNDSEGFEQAATRWFGDRA